MRFNKYIVLVLLMALTSVYSFGQQHKPVKQKPTAIQRFRAPKVKTFLGTYSDTVLIEVEGAKALIGQQLIINDNNKVNYTISSYHFLYKRRIGAEDEETGKTTPSTSIVAEVFKTTPLSAIWINTIRDELIKGEELFFFDVVVRDAKGHLFFAPNLKIITR